MIRDPQQLAGPKKPPRHDTRNMVESDDAVTECGDGISSLQIHDKQQAHNPEVKTYPYVVLFPDLASSEN